MRYKEEGVDHVVCMVCGFKSATLVKHLLLHGLDTAAYRGKYGVGVPVRIATNKKGHPRLPLAKRSGAMQCEICNEWYLKRHQHEHFVKCVEEHPNAYREGASYVCCPECPKKLKRIGRHLQTAHGWDKDRLEIEKGKGLKTICDDIVEKWSESIGRSGGFPVAQKKRKETVLARYGVENPFQAEGIKDRIKETSQRRYGTDHPMQNEDVRIRQSESAQSGPSALEAFFDEHTCPSVVYTGYGGRYIRCKVGVEKYGRVIRDLNPDFMVFPDNVLKSAMSRSSQHKKLDRGKHRTKYVIELLGDYYHSERVIGVTAERHKQEIIDAYASAGIQCLVLWEHEVLQDWDKNQAMIEAWLDSAIADINENPVWAKRTKDKVDGRKATMQCPYGSGRMFKTDASLRRWMDSSKNYWRPGLVEGHDYVVCLECGERCQKLTEHLRKSHGMKKEAYLGLHEGAPLISEVASQAISLGNSKNPRRVSGKEGKEGV
jgi:predicted transcriptional regulator